MLIFFFQRDAGRCETSGEVRGTRSRAAVRNLFTGTGFRTNSLRTWLAESRVDTDGTRPLPWEGYKTDRFGCASRKQYEWIAVRVRRVYERS